MTHHRRSPVAALAPALALSLVVLAGTPRASAAVWPGDVAGRAKGLAALQALEIDLLSRDSATLVLDDWCTRHHLAAPGSRIVADRDRLIDKPATSAQRAALRVRDGEPVRYRRVRLRCGGQILSEADNWYVPARLTPAMNVALETSDTPFGRVVQPLSFHRQTVSARLLWSPLPIGWDSGAPLPAPTTALSVPAYVIENRAMLLDGTGTPFSLLVETYTGHVLDFAAP